MSEFQARVLELVSLVPRGRVTTYKELARAAGKPRAYRAAANTLAKNPRPVQIPCHRVVRSDGRIGGYKLGAKRKAELLASEGVEIEGQKIVLSKYGFRF
ncbi:MAG: MGMT family protein [Hadesarchaea archaeon]|nr:MGMT family protein [Hadesarchaea archaeon]